MAMLQVSIYADALKKITTFHMFLPNDIQTLTTDENVHYKRGIKTLYLLHGFSGTSMDWVIGSDAQEMSIKYNLAIVMPSGDNSFYLDAKGMGHEYARFVGEELVNYVSKTFGLSNKRKDCYIGGLSMGGFGAIHTGLKYLYTFEKMFGLSSALIVNNIKGMQPGTKDAVADYDYYSSVFGNLDMLENSENNLEYLVRKLKEEKVIPSIYMACGTEDFLLRENREFRDFLLDEGVAFTYKESKGIHDWKFWNAYLELAIQWMLQ